MENSEKVSSQLQDQDLYYDTNQLSEACTKWNEAISNSDLSSINVLSEFSPLIQNGVGTSYFSSLDNALKKSDKLALNISRLIASTASDQQSADNSSASNSENIHYNSNYANNSNSNYRTDTTNYSSSNKGANVDVNKDNGNSTIELSENEQVTLVNNFQSIIEGSLYDYLFTQEKASLIKEKLLASPNISNDLKEKISSMDANEIQVKIRDMFISGKTVSDFSKIIITIYDNDLKNNFKNATIFDSANSIANVYAFIVKSDNPQEQLRELYMGTSTISKVDDNVINFTRNFVDTLATAANISFDSILTNSKYKQTILEEMKDLANTYSLIDIVDELGETFRQQFYANIILRTS